MAGSEDLTLDDTMDTDGNYLWDTLPVAVCSDITTRLEHSDFVSMSITCLRWRKVVQGSITSLAPKSVSAMPFIEGCISLRRLHLGQAKPATAAGCLLSFSQITAVTNLTYLDLAISSTAAWQGTAALVPEKLFSHITALKLLQVLNLSHQPLLSQPHILQPLTVLINLQQLALDTSGDDLHLHHSTWTDLAVLTTLRSLDLSGCDLCWDDHSRSDQDQHSTAAAAAATAAAAAAAMHQSLAAAPLYVIIRLVHLQSIRLAHWRHPPCPASILALSQLPDLETLDLSHCIPSTSLVSAPHSMRSLLQGKHPQQQQYHTSSLSASSSSSSRDSCAYFSRLRSLMCTNSDLQYDVTLWSMLSRLACLNLSMGTRFQAHGLSRLQQLQKLVLEGCHQLDYDSLVDFLTTCCCLKHLNLQRSTIILNSSGTTASMLLLGQYRPPPAAAAAAVNASRPQQQQGNAGLNCSATRNSNSSRRDAVATVAASSNSSLWENDSAVIMSEQSTAAAVGRHGAGLEVLLMSRCSLALEGWAWPDLPDLPADPSLLLYDLICQTKQGLSNITVLHWSQCTDVLVTKILTELVPCASNTLQDLDLSSSTLPKTPAPCWQGLAAATDLKTLNLSHVGFSRQGYANICGQNPTVSLLAAVAGMPKLTTLVLAGWRFYFANFHVLAGLKGLRCLDLSQARDVTDSALWSLTHLTSLTKLDVCSAAPSNPHIWGLVFFHLANLKHLVLKNARNFTSSSVSGLTHLRGITLLDIQGTLAGDVSAVNQLVRLSSCQVLAMSLLPAAATGSSRSSSRRLSAEFPRHAAGQPDRSAPAVPTAAADAATATPDIHASNSREDILQQSTEGVQQQQKQQQQQFARTGGVSASGSSSSRVTEEHQLAEYSFVVKFGRCQSLRRLLLGAGPAVAQYCRELLPPWIDVH